MAAAADLHRTLLEINNAIISNLTREDLFHAIARALRRVVPFDRTAIFLHDSVKDVLKLFVLESSLPSTYFTVGLEMAPGESHVGWVFRNRRPLLRRDLEKERQYAIEDRALADGVRSYIIVPLIARGTTVGGLAVASTRVNQYSQGDAEFLQEVANQVALAVENMQAYENITVLNQEIQEEIVRRRQAEEMLRAIAEGTASATGSDFFYSLVRHLAAALKVRYALVGEREGTEKKVRTRAFWSGEDFGGNFEYDAVLTPCLDVLEGTIRCYPDGVQGIFPDDEDLTRLRAESYLGVPIMNSMGRVIGLLAVLDDKPMPEMAGGVSVLKIFAARVGAELERLKVEEQLRTALAEVKTLKDRLQAENVYLQEEIRQEHDFVDMVGSSPPLLAVLRKVEQVAPTDSTVLIFGETGTGKELIAHAIHSRSARKDRPLVKVNCSAISAGLVESELFGHVKGAFTGALERRIGRFELAHGGTIFLDEVGDLPPETQVKLLRVLQEHEFEPVGSSRTIRVDVRVIAATNRDLAGAVRSGRFRSDLFYRLNVFPLAVPPLRERRLDVPPLVMFFLSRFSRRFGKKVDAVSEATMERLVSYPWPGNVRELQNIMERAVVLAQGRALEIDQDLVPGEHPPQRSVQEASGLATLEEMDRVHILAALKQTGGVIEGAKGAARMLNLHPNTLRSRLKKLGIKRHDMS